MVGDLEPKAEIIAIGDELTSGVRLDTNTQWISQQLGQLGIQAAFHTTVGDDLEDMTEVFRIAARRADLVIATGGLGPTADDLTRQAIAKAAGVELEFSQSVCEHIKRMFESRGRPMPQNNEIQAWFPAGSEIVNNPEGTAPGIDLQDENSNCRIFALPGVPVEMKQMWAETVQPELKKMIGKHEVIHHHTLHCFGEGESRIEAMLPGLIERGRDPQVGITASSATISLRVTTKAVTEEECIRKIQPTIETIRDTLGNLVFGENGEQLEEVVIEEARRRSLEIVVADFGTEGAVFQRLYEVDRKIVTQAPLSQFQGSVQKLNALALELQKSNNSTIALVVGPIDRTAEIVAAGKSHFKVVVGLPESIAMSSIRFGGHSQWREMRATKEVLNFTRLCFVD